MKKIIVIGCSGAGKSVFSRKLMKITGLPLYHLDMIWHKPDKTNVSREEFDRKLATIISGDEWIIDGNYGRTLETRLNSCDTVFFLDLPIEVCLEGAMERVGKPRSDMPWIEDELDDDFRRWILNFGNDQLPKIYDLLEKHRDKNIIIFKTREEINEYFASVTH